MDALELAVRPVVVLVLRAALIYAAAGIVFAVAFQAWGLRRLDPVAAGSTWGFRILITPGVVLLWPWLAGRWWENRVAAPADSPTHAAVARRPSPRQLRVAHRWAWKVLAVVGPLLIMLAAAHRPRATEMNADDSARVGLFGPQTPH